MSQFVQLPTYPGSDFAYLSGGTNEENIGGVLNEENIGGGDEMDQ